MASPINIDINTIGAFSQILFYVGWSLAVIVIFGMFAAVGYLWTFNIKVRINTLVGTTQDSMFSVSRTKSNRVKIIKINGVDKWKPLWPLMNKITHPIFDSKYIYKKGYVECFEVGKDWVPMVMDVNKKGNNVSDISLSAVPHHVREYQSLKYKQNALDFAKESFWDQNKNFILGVLTVLVCCVLCGITIWLSFKFAAGNMAEIIGPIQEHTRALNNFGTIPASGIGG